MDLREKFYWRKIFDSFYNLGEVNFETQISSQPMLSQDLLFLKQKLNLHVIGNSHAHSFTGSPLGEFGRGSNLSKPWNSYSLGPLSSIDLQGSKSKVLEKFLVDYEIKSDSKLIFTFGEAESRWYIPKHFDSKKQADRNWKIQDSLDFYLEAAKEVILKFSNSGYEVFVWGGHPSTSKDLKDQLRDEKNIPIITSYEERLNLGWNWHESMRKFAISNNLCFISIFPSMVSVQNKTIEYYLEDDCHIKSHIIEGFLLPKLSEREELS